MKTSFFQGERECVRKRKQIGKRIKETMKGRICKRKNIRISETLKGRICKRKNVRNIKE
jgi:hypothetical protein